MGRHRSTNLDLPPRMTRKGASYYYVCSSKPRRWLPLGNDLAVAKRRWVELEAGPAAPAISVGELVQQYVARETRPHTTALQYASYQRTLAAAFPIPANQLTSQHVALWRELQRDRRVYCNGCIGLLVAAFRLGHELGQCNLLSVSKWQVAGRDRDMLPAEFRAIRAVAPAWLRVAMDLGYLTGARPSDILALRWDAISDGRIALRQRKTGQRQEFVISDDLASVLEAARQRPIVGLYVVASDRGRPVTRNTFSYAWLRAVKQSSVEGVQFRDIRAMAAKAAKTAGMDYQALLGHTTRGMSERYIKGRSTLIVEPNRKRL